MSRQLLVGVDVGTSSVKALFITTEGEVVARIERPLSTKSGAHGIAEQDAEEYWENLKSIFAEAHDLASDVVAIGLSGQTPSPVLVDEAGVPTSSVLIWQDTRAIDQARRLESHFGDPVPWIGTSLPWSASACPAKLLWLAEEMPAVVEATRWVLQPKDFIGMRMTGEAISDPWSSKGLCNVITLEPVTEVFEQVGWEPRVVPPIRQGTDTRGYLSDQAAKDLGLSTSIPVSVGLSDAMCGMLSLGALTQEQAFIITGTSAIVGVSTRETVSSADGLYVIPNTCAPMTVVYGPTQTSGAAVAWAASLLNLSVDELIEQAGRASLDDLPIFLPYIDGERAPLWRPDIRGSFTHVGVRARQPEFAAAVLHGISFTERSVLEEAITRSGVDPSAITLGGHAGNDHRWDRFRLRTLGKVLHRKTDNDSTTRGSAMLALVSLDIDLSEAVNLLAPPGEVSTPSDTDCDFALSQYEKFLHTREVVLHLYDDN